MRTILGFKIYETEQVIDFLQGCISNLAVLALYIVITLGLLKIANHLIEKMFQKILNSNIEHEHKKQIATIKNLVKSLSNGIIVIILGLSLLGRYNIDIRPLLAAAGVAGVALGFAAQKFVEDIIMGILILLEGQLRVGDFVNIDGISGTVEKVTLKMVILRSPNGHVNYIRNGIIRVITNQTRDFASPIFDIGVAYNSNIDKVMSVMKTVAQDMRKNENYSKYILSDMDILGLNEFQDSALVIRATMKTKAPNQWFIQREYNKLLKEAFDKEGIEIPFPQRDLHIIKSE